MEESRSFSTEKDQMSLGQKTRRCYDISEVQILEPKFGSLDFVAHVTQV